MGNADGSNPSLNPYATTDSASHAISLNSINGALVRPGMSGPGQPASAPYVPPIQTPARPINPDDPVVPHNGFSTHEEAEKAFWHLLRKAGITPESSWEDSIRAIITDPLYKSFNSMAERKESWQKVCALSHFLCKIRPDETESTLIP